MSKFHIIFLHIQYENSKSLILFNANFAVGNLQLSGRKLQLPAPNFKLMMPLFSRRIIIGSDRRPETKQGIEGKIDRFR